MVIECGEIWWAELPDPTGSGPGYRRPILVVQSDDFNMSLINTVIIVVLTTNLKLARAPGNVLISKKRSGLPKDSVANVSQILTIDKSLLTRHVGILPSRLLEEVREGLKLALAL